MVWDQSLALILYGKGSVYVDPRIVSHHRTIVEKGGTNYQSRYAVEDHKVSDAFMYACHEEYIENILHRKCKNFYNVRGMIFAESFWIALLETEVRRIGIRLLRSGISARRNGLWHCVQFGEDLAP